MEREADPGFQMSERTMNSMKTFAALGVAVFAMSACVVDKTDKADTTAVVTSVDTAANPPRTDVVPTTDTTRAPTPAPAPPPKVGDWEVTPTGIGSIKTGMSIEEAQVILHNDLVVPANLSECAFLKTKSGPKGVLFMVEQRHISRVDVTAGSTATSAGARVGDTEDKIKSLYSGIAVTPHKYTDGHYLTYSGNGGKIVFETDGSKVTRYRSGTTPAVDYVEGCS
jgi:hypothetical protein